MNPKLLRIGVGQRGIRFSVREIERFIEENTIGHRS